MKNSIGRLVSILHRQSQIYINNALKDFDITSAEYSFLLCLYKKDGVTQDDLSDYLYIDKSATARAIKSLEQKGYVTRDRDEEDRRFNRIYLTNKAKLNKTEITKRIWRWSELLAEELDKETVDTVLSVLQEMVDKVERINLNKEME